ncbi:MAG: amino acid permease [Thermomicrobiales bacterium]
MPGPDRDQPDQPDQERPPRRGPKSGAQTGDNDDAPRSRVRIKTPRRPTATEEPVKPPARTKPSPANDAARTPSKPSAFRLEGAPTPAVGDDADPSRLDPSLGLGWLSPEGQTSRREAGPSPGATRNRVVRPPRKSGTRVQPDLTGRQELRGTHPGDRYVRVVRQQSDDFERAGPGHLVATEDALEARGAVGRTFGKVKRVLIGAPLTTAAAAHERLTKVKALAVLSSDALSSVAYATEEILRILLLAGIVALSHSLPIGAGIVVLLIIVGVSYRQTIKAYPHGGGSYIVAKDNLGELPALTAGAALLFGYIMTVAVSIAAGVAALISAIPELQGHRIWLAIAFISLVTILNLRGIRESGTIFSVPTYLFLIGVFALIGIGIVRNALDGFAVQDPPDEATALAGTGAVTLFLVLRAFSAGCAALTGVEAISDGVPAFKPPEWKNARATLTWMITILAITFAGITFLAHQYGAFPMSAHESGYETVVSQIARAVFGGENVGYFYIQFATLAILILAANTAYSDFPRLSYFLARDRYMPRQFTFRGDRLAFSTGIITLGLFSVLILVIFGGETERLIPLYAFGVFTAFTLSEAGMVRRWWRLREEGWQRGLAINLAGAIATGVVAIVFGISNFTRGAWIVIVLIPLLILAFRAIHHHYHRATTELAAQTPLDPSEIRHTVIVPIAAVNRIARQTLAYARSISDNVTAVHISDDDAEIERMRNDWQTLGTDIPLVIIESPYRALVGPLLAYIDEIDHQRPDDTLTVVLPEYLARHWWEHVLHNQTALRIKAALLFRPGTVVTSVPYHLERTPE